MFRYMSGVTFTYRTQPMAHLGRLALAARLALVGSVLILCACLGVTGRATAQVSPSETGAEPTFRGLREEVRRAHAILRVQITSVKLKNAPVDWLPTNPPTPDMVAECIGIVRAAYKGVAAKVGEEIKLQVPLLQLASYYAGPLTKAGRQFFDGDAPKVGDDRIFFVEITGSRFQVFNSSRVFFDWTIDSDSLFRRYTELSWTDSGSTAVSLVKLLVRILIGDPARGDPYGVRSVILDDWQRYRRFLAPGEDTTRLVRLVIPDMVTTARYAAEGAPLPIVIALAPLLGEADRREIVGALLRLRRSFSDPAPVDEAVARRRRNLEATLPVMLELVMHPTRDAATSVAPDAVFAEATAFASEAVDHSDPAWHEWVAALADKARQADRAREGQADITTLTANASDVILGERSSEKVGNDYHLVLFRVHRWVKNSGGAAAGQFAYVRLTPESKRLVTRLRDPSGAPIPVMVFLNSVPEAVQKTWAFRGQQLSTIDQRRFEIADPENGIIAANSQAAGTPQTSPTEPPPS